MEKSWLNHFQFNVAAENLGFYRSLFTFLDWQIIVDQPDMLAVEEKRETGFGVSLWFTTNVKPVKNDYDGPGLNHIAIGAGSVEDVNAAASFLVGKGTPSLFETPRHRPDFSSNENSTYYQVMFESPDRLLFEIVYMGPKPPHA